MRVCKYLFTRMYMRVNFMYEAMSNDSSIFFYFAVSFAFLCYLFDLDYATTDSFFFFDRNAYYQKCGFNLIRRKIHTNSDNNNQVTSNFSILVMLFCCVFTNNDVSIRTSKRK